MSDLLIDRIMYDPGAQELAPIPWPAGLAPKPLMVKTAGNLPVADVLIVCFTAAEARATADVLTPGVQFTDWEPYRKNFAAYEPMLTNRSPARESRTLGSWHATRIGTKRCVVYHSALHPATDGPELPLAKLWQQLISEAHPSLVITTGTAGAVGAGTQLGDVVVADKVTWDCEKQFRAESWAHTSYTPAVELPGALDNLAPLLAPNFARLPGNLLTEHRPPSVWVHQAGLVTTDFFAMGDTTDAYGLLKAQTECRVVDMDDAALGVAIGEMTDPPRWLSIRNASDPVMDGSLPLEEQSKQASKIYEKCGYTTTIGSAIACWAVVAHV